MTHEIPPAGRPILRRRIGCAALAVLVLVFLTCLGVLPEAMIALPFHLAVGWFSYLLRVLPEVTVSWPGVLTAAACTIGVIVIGHHTLRWLSSGADPAAPPRRWKLRYTLATTAAVLLMFVAGIATVGITHQTAWLARSDEPVFAYRGRTNANRVICAANLKTIYQACLLYANENNGRLPDSFETILVTQDVAPEVFCCRSSATAKAPGKTAAEQAARLHLHCDYVYHARGLTTRDLDRLGPDVPIAAEPLANHNGAGLNVLFADGHVDWIPAARAAEVLNRLPPPRP